MSELVENINNVHEETTSGATSDGLGGTAKQGDMAGSDAHKKATIQERIDSTTSQQQDLQRMQRLAPAQREMTVEERLTKERQEQLARLGNIGLGIQNTISSQLQAAAQAKTGEAQVRLPALATALGLTDAATLDLAKQDPNSNYNKIRIALEQYSGGDPNNMEQALATMDNLQLQGLSAADARRLVGLTQETMAAQTGAVLARNVLDDITVGDIDLAQMGFEGGSEAVAAALQMDPEDIAALSMDQLADKIRERQKVEFSRVDSLRAELANAPLGSVRREVLLRELRQLGEVGVTGLEVDVAETVEDIDMGRYIKVGDKRIKVSELLADEALSDRISDYLNESNPTRKQEKEDELRELGSQDLVDWVNANQMALAKVSETGEDTYDQYQDANDAYTTLNNLEEYGLKDTVLTADFMADLIPGWDPEQKVTSAQLAEIKATFNASEIGSLLNDQNIETEDQQGIIDALNSMSPEDREEYKGKTKDELVTAYDAVQITKETPGLADFLGLDTSNPFILDGDIQDNIDEYKDIVGKIHAEYPDWLTATGAIGKALKTLKPAQLQELYDHPGRYDDIKEYYTYVKDGDRVENDSDKLSFILGGTAPVDLEDLNSQYQKALMYSRLGDPDAKAYIDKYRDIFGLEEGATSITTADLDAAMEVSRGALNDMDLNDMVAFGVDMSELSDIKKEWSGVSGEYTNTNPELTDLYNLVEKYGSNILNGDNLETVIWHRGERFSSDFYTKLAGMADKYGWNKSTLEQYASHQGRQEFHKEFSTETWDEITKYWQGSWDLMDHDARDRLKQYAAELEQKMPSMSASAQGWAKHAYHRALQAVQKYQDNRSKWFSKDHTVAQQKVAEKKAATEAALSPEAKTFRASLPADLTDDYRQFMTAQYDERLKDPTKANKRAEIWKKLGELNRKQPQGWIAEAMHKYNISQLNKELDEMGRLPGSRTPAKKPGVSVNPASDPDRGFGEYY